VPNYNKLHSFDEQTIQILESVPKRERSAFVREGVLLRHKQELNPELKEEPKPTFEVIG
jgi:hypothetical protein